MICPTIFLVNMTDEDVDFESVIRHFILHVVMNNQSRILAYITIKDRDDDY